MADYLVSQTGNVTYSPCIGGTSCVVPDMAGGEQKIRVSTGGDFNLENGAILSISPLTNGDCISWSVTSSTYVYGNYGIMKVPSHYTSSGWGPYESSFGWIGGAGVGTDGCLFRLYASSSGDMYDGGNEPWVHFREVNLSDAYLIAVVQAEGGYWVLKPSSNKLFWGSDISTNYGTLHITGIKSLDSELCLSYYISTGQNIVSVYKPNNETPYNQGGGCDDNSWTGFGTRSADSQFPSDVLSIGDEVILWSGGDAYDIPEWNGSNSWFLNSSNWSDITYNLNYLGTFRWTGTDWISV